MVATIVMGSFEIQQTLGQMFDIYVQILGLLL